MIVGYDLRFENVSEIFLPHGMLGEKQSRAA
jgi:hypothetical protein